MNTIRRTIATIALLTIATIAAAQVSASTTLEIHEAAAFTDGFIVDCGGIPDATILSVCVDTSRTPWDAFDLMNWSDYGLSRWSIDRAWTRDAKGRWYDLQLYRDDRRELLMITVFSSGNMVMYHATRY